MSARQFLYLTADGLRWYQMDAGQAVLQERFAADEDGVAAFGRQLARQPRSMQYAVLVDVAEEGFNFELLPSTRGRDRAAMLSRKLGQQFYGSPYTAALSLGREKQGRRDERVLLSALTRPAQIEPWIGTLISAKVRVRGVHSAPFLLDRIMARARLPVSSYLLVNFTPAGVRQTYFNQGRLRFSRLAGGHDLSFEQQLAQAGEEIRKTLAYLAGQRMTRRGETLPVVGLVAADQYDAFAKGIADGGELASSLAETGHLRGSYGVPEGRGGNADSLTLLLDALGTEPQCVQIGGEPVLRYQQIHQIRTGLYLAALAILLGGAGIAGLAAFESASVEREISDLKRLVSSENGRYEALMQRLPPLPAPDKELRRVVDEVDGIEAGRVAPLAIYQAVSGALEQLPELTLEALEWRSGEAPEGDTVTVTARLALPSGMSGDQRSLIETSERFVGELARVTGQTVRLTRRPVLIRSNETLRMRDGEEGASRTSPPVFEVEFPMNARTRD